MQTSVSGKRLVTLILGDGVGPEVVRSAQRIVEAAGSPVAWQECEAGADVFNRGLPSGVPAETIESIRETRVVLKGPLETPGTGRGPTKIPPGSTLALTNRRSTT